jgi:integrase
VTGMPPTMDAAAAIEFLRRALGGTGGTLPTVKELWAHYQRAERGNLRSWSDSEARGRTLLAFFGDRHAMELTPLDVDAYREHRRSMRTRRKLAPTPATRNREVSLLRRLLNFSVDNRLLPINPLARVKLEAERNIRQTVLGEEALQRLLAECGPVVRAIVLVLADSGMRRMEALRLRHDQVDAATGIVTLTAEDTKTGRPRKVRLTRRAVAAIKALARHPASPYVFTARSGRLYHPRHIYRLYQAAVARAGIEGVHGEPITLHLWRHSFVAKARRAGIQERVVMQMTGHTTRSAFDRYGGAIAEGELDDAMATLEGGRRRPRPRK